MNSQKRVHIGGVFYGMHNIGDEAILYSMVREFGKTYRISVSSYDSEWLLNYFPETELKSIHAVYAKPKLGLSVVPRRNIISNRKKVMADREILCSADGYICGGATILSDCPWHSLKTVEHAGRLGKRVILWGVGMADGTDQDTDNYIRKILNMPYVVKVYTRDKFVQDRLKKTGVLPDKLSICYDPAIMLEGTEFILENYLTDKEIDILNNGLDNICISISGEVDIASKTPVDEICEFVKLLLKNGRYNIFLIPTGCGGHCQDRRLLQEIKKQCSSDNVIMIEKEFEPDHLVWFLKKFRLSVSSRLHLNIFSACAGIPSIGLVRNSKITDFAKIFSLPALQISGLRASDIMKAVNKLEKENEFYKAEIRKQIDFMRKAHHIAISEVENQWLSLQGGNLGAFNK